jgi:RNA polymerase sigma factor (sigma-70 family)
LGNDRLPEYEEFIGPIEDRMIRSIWRITRDADDADDALQNALVVVWKRWSRIGRHPNPQALVLRVCIDAAFDVTRRRGRDRRDVESIESADSVDPRSVGPMEHIEGEERRQAILAAIGRLSRQQAVAVMLRVFEELPFDQIAAAMGCREATARKHFARARVNLRLALAQLKPDASSGKSA